MLSARVNAKLKLKFNSTKFAIQIVFYFWKEKNPFRHVYRTIPVHGWVWKLGKFITSSSTSISISATFSLISIYCTVYKYIYIYINTVNQLKCLISHSHLYLIITIIKQIITTWSTFCTIIYCIHRKRTYFICYVYRSIIALFRTS